MRRIHSDRNGDGGAVLLQWDGERYLLGSLPPSAFLYFFSIWVGSSHPGVQDPVQPSQIPFSQALPVTGLAISHHVLPRSEEAGGEVQSECMRLRENKAGKAQARGHYRGGIGGRSNPSPSGCTYLHGKSRMTSQLRKLAWGGEGGARGTVSSGRYGGGFKVSSWDKGYIWGRQGEDGRRLQNIISQG